MGRSLTGKGVLTTPPFGPFCRAAGAQSANQPLHTDPLTPSPFNPFDNEYASFKIIISLFLYKRLCQRLLAFFCMCLFTNLIRI